MENKSNQNQNQNQDTISKEIEKWKSIFQKKPKLSSIKKPQKAGFLTKKGVGMFSNWKRRYFVAKGPFMYYFLSEKDDEKALGVIYLRNCTLLKNPNPSKQFEFSIDTIVSRKPGKKADSTRIYQLCSTSSLEKDSWCEIISHFARPKEDNLLDI
ncbi:sesquipedalian [Anaeramoeba ignava]|uniref:Sesquipedalian n=1 Tax=Anaeramoeba ignava TaxID=1746090 RepID=A0A9Q0LL66_ANAIG|nr:sesquipedalian [Anaeramoeba ignava]